MTTREDFWKGVLVVLNISVWVERPWTACNSFPVCLKWVSNILFVYLISSTALTPLSLVYRIPVYLWSFTKSKSSSAPERTRLARKFSKQSQQFMQTSRIQHRLLKFNLATLIPCLLGESYKLLNLSLSPQYMHHLLGRTPQLPFHQTRGKYCHWNLVPRPGSCES